MNGRLQFANDLPYDAKHSILFTKDHAMTRLVINDVHKKLGHGTGVEHFLNELRAHYWIVKGRRAVKSAIETSQECRGKFNSKPAGQLMAALPKMRCTQSLRAFQNIGVDYAGPYVTKHARMRKTEGEKILVPVYMSSHQSCASRVCV